MPVALSPYALTTIDTALAHLERKEGSEDDADDRIRRAVNWATHEMERFTKRRLAARTYRSTTVISCTSTANSKTLGGTGFVTSLKALDDVVGTPLSAGSRVASITSAVALELNVPAVSAATFNATFGSERLRMDGTGEAVLWLPERPVIEVYAAAYVDDDGTETALDLTGARLVRETGEYRIPYDTAPKGDGNILVSCAAGYRQATATSLGDDDWYDLEHWCLRLTEIYFKDSLQRRGRETSGAIMSESSGVPHFKMPEDAAAGLARYVRHW